MGINTFTDIKGGNQNGLTGKVKTLAFTSNVAAVEAYSTTKGTAKYTLSSNTHDLRNLIGLDIVISSCTSAANNGTFHVEAVGVVSNAIYVVNPNAVTQAGAAGTAALTFDINALDVNVSLSGVSLSVSIDNTTDDILVYGWDGTNNKKIKTNTGGQLEVIPMGDVIGADWDTCDITMDADKDITKMVYSLLDAPVRTIDFTLDGDKDITKIVRS